MHNTIPYMMVIILMVIIMNHDMMVIILMVVVVESIIVIRWYIACLIQFISNMILIQIVVE